MKRVTRITKNNGYCKRHYTKQSQNTCSRCAITKEDILEYAKKQREYADQQEELSGEICTKNLDQRKVIESLKEEKESLMHTSKRKEEVENRLRDELGKLINRNQAMEDELTLRSCEEKTLRDRLNIMSEILTITRTNQKEKV